MEVGNEEVVGGWVVKGKDGEKELQATGQFFRPPLEPMSVSPRPSLSPRATSPGKPASAGLHSPFS